MPRLIQVLLALSLLLNAFFVAGFVFRSWVAPLPFERQMPPPPPGQRPSALEIVTNDVNLDDSQRQALRGVFEQYSAARRDRCIPSRPRRNFPPWSRRAQSNQCHHATGTKQVIERRGETSTSLSHSFELVIACLQRWMSAPLLRS